MTEGRKQRENDKFIPQGQPLSEAEEEELAKIRVKDVRVAIESTDDELKLFLDAKQAQKK